MSIIRQCFMPIVCLFFYVCLFLLDNYIYYLAGHNDYFDNLLAFQPLCSGGIAECQALDIGAVCAGGYGDGEASLAVERYGIRLCVGAEIAFFGLRPSGIADGGCIAQRVP